MLDPNRLGPKTWIMICHMMYMDEGGVASFDVQITYTLSTTQLFSNIIKMQLQHNKKDNLSDIRNDLYNFFSMKKLLYLLVF